MKHAVVVAVLTVGLFVACRDQQSVTAVKPGLSADFSDGRSTGGNPHFFFLPPLVSQPSFSGVFNPLLQPVVDICQLNTSVTPAVCDTRPGAPADIILGPVLDATGQTYHVNWDTGQPAISTTQFYRIQVFGSPGGLLLGFADMDPVANGSQLKNVNTGQYIGLVDGRTLPIKFRIENGAFLTDHSCTDCVEATVTNNGGTVVTNTGFAGAQFPAGWLASPNPVVVTIERQAVNDQVAGSECIPSLGLNQFEGCYDFKTSPTAQFATNVTVGVCANVPEPAHDVIQLFKVDIVNNEPVTTALPNVPAPFVSCEGFLPTPSSIGFLNGLPGRLFRTIERLLSPKAAYAFHLGAGGSTCCFSRIGWALPSGTLIDPDVAPGGAAITPGAIINTTYANLGVTFSRLRGELETPQCGASNNVYANDNGPLESGAFGFNSGDNVITICAEGTASDFSEAGGGRIAASFSGSPTQVCIQAYVTGFQPGSLPGARALLEAFNSDGGRIAADTSQPNAFGENLCVQASGIASVQFAGVQTGFAMFDNLMVTFPPIE